MSHQVDHSLSNSDWLDRFVFPIELVLTIWVWGFDKR
jgi:hypothetical protein